MDSIEEKAVFLYWTVTWDEEFVVKGCDNEICDSYGKKYPTGSSSINGTVTILEEHNS